MSLSTCKATLNSSSSLGGFCTCSLCKDGISSAGLDMTGTFIDLTRCRHPAECPCSDCTAPKQLDTPSILDSMESLRSNLPVAGKTLGWLAPARPSGRAMACTEIQLQVDQTFSVGREQSCDIVLEDFMFDSTDENLQCNKTSRVQFEIISVTERPFIMDKSMNGTFLNGEKLSHGVAKRLNHGDTISILHPEYEIFNYLDEFQMADSVLRRARKDMTGQNTNLPAGLDKQPKSVPGADHEDTTSVQNVRLDTKGIGRLSQYYSPIDQSDCLEYYSPLHGGNKTLEASLNRN